MMKLAGKVLAVPVRLAADILGYLRVADPTTLRTWAWKLSGDADDGIGLLILTAQKRGVSGARGLAEEMMAKVNDSSLAAAMGVMEIQFGEGFKAAERWVQLAKMRNAKKPEMLLSLELVLSDQLDGYDTAGLAEAILSRNDLPGSFSRQGLCAKAELFLEQRQWGNAGKIADRILDLEEYPLARWIKWTAATAEGRLGEAEGHIQRAREMWSEGYTLMMMAMGWYYMGDRVQTIELMLDAEKAGMKAEYMDRRLAELAGSEEYIKGKRDSK